MEEQQRQVQQKQGLLRRALETKEGSLYCKRDKLGVTQRTAAGVSIRFSPSSLSSIFLYARATHQRVVEHFVL